MQHDEQDSGGGGGGGGRERRVGHCLPATILMTMVKLKFLDRH